MRIIDQGIQIPMYLAHFTVTLSQRRLHLISWPLPTMTQSEFVGRICKPKMWDQMFLHKIVGATPIN